MRFAELGPDDKIAYVREVLRRGKYFRTARVWDFQDKFDYEGWLDNFSGIDERYIAARILSSFLYFSARMVDSMLYDAVGRAASEISKRRQYVDADKDKIVKEKIFYCYIPGEEYKATDSGQYFMRKVRDVLHVPEEQIISFQEFIKKCTSPSPYYNVVFCDDVIGSGKQCDEAFRTYRSKLDMSIYEYAQKHNYFLAFVPLVANSKSLAKLKKSMPKMMFAPLYVLTEEYDLFDEKCLCWDGDADLFKLGVELIRTKSEMLGVPDNGDVLSMRGYRNQGWAIGFEHGIPDAVPALFYYSQKGWKPLMWRDYVREENAE